MNMADTSDARITVSYVTEKGAMDDVYELSMLLAPGQLDGANAHTWCVQGMRFGVPGEQRGGHRRWTAWSSGMRSAGRQSKANSAQEYIDKLYNQSQGVAGQLHEQRKKSDDEVIQQINAAIDRATASSTNPYKTQMEQLPSQYQPLFDANAVQELVGRRQVQEAMANMGLTDSGLNRTQQTALSVQRGNADASVRLAQQQKTQELQDKISQLVENAAAQKQQQEATIRGNTSDWYNTLLSNFYNTAQQQGTGLYNAEQERRLL